ncbi:MAG: succinate dehydrogenase, cytochrome b556 subunit [Rhodospirillales bacterium]|nr:succinate dehydrogenase, cytochrome b556 subunit [Rhodospirillales bacterium]
MATRNRPLSPHLQVYKLPVSAQLSISHRITGVILCGGAVLLTYWLMAATYGPEAFATAQAILGSWIGKLVLLGVVFSLWYHLANGIRHLIWDTGRGLELPQLRTSGMVVVASAVILTVATFVLAYTVGN